MINISLSLVITSLVVGTQYPIIGTFVYDKPMTNCSLQMSPNLKDWYEVPNDDVLILSNGDWAINPTTPYCDRLGNINKGRMFYRVISRP